MITDLADKLNQAELEALNFGRSRQRRGRGSVGDGYGIPAADHHVQLLELAGKPDDEGLHTLKQIMESREGHFVHIKRIA